LAICLVIGRNTKKYRNGVAKVEINVASSNASILCGIWGSKENANIISSSLIKIEPIKTEMSFFGDM
jgi:hypothetical protein